MNKFLEMIKKQLSKKDEMRKNDIITQQEIAREKEIRREQLNEYRNNLIISLGYSCEDYVLEKNYNSQINSFIIDDRNLIYFFPRSLDRRYKSFEFIKDEKVIINNDNNYEEIANLNDILLELTKLFNKAFDLNIILDPSCLMIRLDGEIKENYNKNASIVLNNAIIKNGGDYIEDNFLSSKLYFLKSFLNVLENTYKKYIDSNEEIKKIIETLNDKMDNLTKEIKQEKENKRVRK